MRYLIWTIAFVFAGLVIWAGVADVISAVELQPQAASTDWRHERCVTETASYDVSSPRSHDQAYYQAQREAHARRTAQCERELHELDRFSSDPNFTSCLKQYLHYVRLPEADKDDPDYYDQYQSWNSQMNRQTQRASLCMALGHR